MCERLHVRILANRAAVCVSVCVSMCMCVCMSQTSRSEAAGCVGSRPPDSFFHGLLSSAAKIPEVKLRHYEVSFSERPQIQREAEREREKKNETITVNKLGDLGQCTVYTKFRACTVM